MAKRALEIGAAGGLCPLDGAARHGQNDAGAQDPFDFAFHDT